MSSTERIMASYQLHAEYMDFRWRQIMEAGTIYVRFYNTEPRSEIAKAIDGKVFRASDPDIRIPPFSWNDNTGIGPISESKFKREGMVVSRFRDMRKFDGILPEFDLHPNSPDRNIAALTPSDEDVLKYEIRYKGEFH